MDSVSAGLKEAAMTTKTGGRCPIKRADITESKVEDDLVLFDPRTDAAHVLNPTAALVWWLCDGSRKEAEIVNELESLFETVPAALAADVAKSLSDFASVGIIRWK